MVHSACGMDRCVIFELGSMAAVEIISPVPAFSFRVLDILIKISLPWRLFSNLVFVFRVRVGEVRLWRVTLLGRLLLVAWNWWPGEISLSTAISNLSVQILRHSE